MEALLSAWDEAWGMRWSPTVVSCSVILHHCKVRSVRLSISHGLVMHLGPRQPSSLPFWEALWLRPSVTFLQQTISEAPTAPANSSPAWFQSPPNGLNPVLTPFLSPDKFYNCQISQGEHQNKKKITDVKKQHFEVIVDNVYGITHSSCYFRRKGGNGHSKTTSNTVSLYWLLALKFWFINSPRLLIYSISSGMILFSSFQPSWEMNLFFFNLYFLLNLGNFFFTQSKPCISFCFTAY